MIFDMRNVNIESMIHKIKPDKSIITVVINIDWLISFFCGQCMFFISNFISFKYILLVVLLINSNVNSVNIIKLIPVTIAKIIIFFVRTLVSVIIRINENVAVISSFNVMYFFILLNLPGQEGFEPPTRGFGDRCSTGLSHWPFIINLF